VVTGVGHEIDFTIADLVADYRAATPSAAAEVCSPHRDAITARLTTLATQIATAVAREIKTQGQHLRFLHSRIEHPGKRIEQCYQRVDQLARRLPDWVRIFIQIRGARLETVGARLMAANPRRKCVLAAETLARLRQQLEAAARRKLAERKARLAEATRALRAVGPQATLERGYAIVTDAAGNIARDAAGFSLGEKIEARLAQGSLGLEVESIHLEGGDQ
jgi:exodeoxyribonuclease VII large subunit